MNEILRAKKLTAEILARAAAIKDHMTDINQRMQQMEQVNKVVADKEPGAPQLQLLDLPDDLLGHVSKALMNYDDIVALSRVSGGSVLGRGGLPHGPTNHVHSTMHL